ncbi:MAG: Uncharacterised protein [Cryomorphaceae bacterium]|nr:MAG: Uncharacterised protein [Cryomorphaceae bacterium]
MLVITLGTLSPISSVIGFLGILNVNNDGTGLIILYPNFFNQSNPLSFGLPPLAIITISKIRVSPLMDRIIPFSLTVIALILLL